MADSPSSGGGQSQSEKFVLSNMHTLVFAGAMTSSELAEGIERFMGIVDESHSTCAKFRSKPLIH